MTVLEAQGQIDTTNLGVGRVFNGQVLDASPSYYAIRALPYSAEFIGTFVSNLFGIYTGTLTRWIQDFEGLRAFNIESFSIPMDKFLGWMSTNDNSSVSAALFSGDDSMTGSAFADLLSSLSGNDTVSGGLGDDAIIDSSGANYLRGDEGNDSITGGTGFDDINGNMGNDTCVSGGGDDWVVGGKDNDSLAGSAGQNLVYGNIGNDTCEGGDGNDIVRGGQDNDVIFGGAGDDYVSGDKGADTVTGGAGADLFHTFGDAGVDRVLDFNLAQGDRVQLDPGTRYTVTQSGSDTVIDMTGGGQMVLVGVQMSTLHAGWIFGA